MNGKYNENWMNFVSNSVRCQTGFFLKNCQCAGGEKKKQNYHSAWLKIMLVSFNGLINKKRY